MQVIYRRTNTFLHSSLNWFKILLKRKIIFFDKITFSPTPPKNLRPKKGFNAHNNMIRKTRKRKTERKGKDTALEE